MIQLVGLRCLRCEQEIWSFLEGRFCPACGTPNHHRCERPDTTPESASRCPVCQCNLDNPFVAQFRDEQRRQAEAPARRVGLLVFAAVALLQLIAVVNLAVAVWITWAWYTFEPVIGVQLGVALLAPVVLIEVVALALQRRRKWAWTAAVVVFALALPGVAGIVGLLILFRPGVRQLFEKRSPRRGAVLTHSGER
jgi:hypothetical protein